ncbi:hypothetical protein [Azotobacter salinestris]|uniref:hypothetical protein n=1 Tax=Azotobacter salinestris TaxID=69964 RepID=UPI001266E094|nr:hypothetical protein [Azotobacter salinestris]
MAEFSVTLLIDASTSMTVTADTPEDAAELAMDEAGNPSLCHYCSGKMDVGDVYAARVYDGDKEVLDTDWTAQQLAAAEKQVEKLEKRVAELEQAEQDAVKVPRGLLECYLNGGGDWVEAGHKLRALLGGGE